MEELKEVAICAKDGQNLGDVRPESGVIEKKVDLLESFTAKTPVTYEYKRGGGTIWLSMRERECVEAFLRVRSYSKTAAWMRERFKSRMGQETVKRWLNRSYVVEYVKQRVEDIGLANGWTKEKYLAEWVRRLRDNEDVSSAETYILRNIGEILGYYEAGVKKGEMNFQINFTQMDGGV